MLTRINPRVFVLASVPALIAFSYLVSPYVALYRLSTALEARDVAALRASIDWNRVRASLAVELAGDPAPVATPSATVAAVAPASAEVTVRTAPPAPAGDDDLPAFGDSFASTAMGNAITADITPESVAAMLHDHPVTMVNAGGSLLAEARQMVDWAFFSGPRSFDVWLRPDQNPHEAPVRLHLAFTRQHGWRVVGVWLPQDMLSGGSDTSHST